MIDEKDQEEGFMEMEDSQARDTTENEGGDLDVSGVSEQKETVEQDGPDTKSSKDSGYSAPDGGGGGPEGGLGAGGGGGGDASSSDTGGSTGDAGGASSGGGSTGSAGGASSTGGTGN